MLPFCFRIASVMLVKMNALHLTVTRQLPNNPFKREKIVRPRPTPHTLQYTYLELTHTSLHHPRASKTQLLALSSALAQPPQNGPCPTFCNSVKKCFRSASVLPRFLVALRLGISVPPWPDPHRGIQPAPAPHDLRPLISVEAFRELC